MNDRTPMGLNLAGGGAFAAALAYSLTALCCLPVAFGAAGAALAGVAGFLDPFEPYLAGISLFFLAIAFYRAYRHPTDCAAGRPCPPARPRKALWLIAVAVLVLLTSRLWISRFL
ncbi:MAG TPA: mercuric transporter MerT family protein [Thermoanaerobaculia bacterium]